jgi:hypothetical protein
MRLNDLFASLCVRSGAARAGSRETTNCEETDGNRACRRAAPGVAVIACGLLSAVLVVLGEPARAADNDAERLRSELNDEHATGTDLWIYNDIPAAMAEARRLNRPLFVTFRCVPCTACKAFDAEVAKGNDVIQEFARKNFVSVRQVEMKGVDLSLFQFDHDLNWAAMFLNGDGTIYARYGTQSEAGPDAYNSIEGLKATMERVLKLHAEYPANRSALAGKRGPDKQYPSALEMPGLEEGRATFEELTSRRNCIHCHMIHDAEHRQAQADGTFDLDMLWRYPLPENVGLTIDGVSGVRIAAVIAGSPAAKAGLQVGEDVTHMNGQPITSIADIQWVLHLLENAQISVEVTGSQSGTHTLSLAPGWKQSDFSWRGSMWSVSPKLRIWTPPVEEAQRKELGVSDGEGAFLVKWINAESDGGKAAKEAGLREGDILVAADGQSLPLKPQQFNAYLILQHKVGDMLPLTIVRDGKRMEVSFRLVE